MPRVVTHITELIGNTPAVRLNRLCSQEMAEVYVKLESLNPSGSVKDRAAYYMISGGRASG